MGKKANKVESIYAEPCYDDGWRDYEAQDFDEKTQCKLSIEWREVAAGDLYERLYEEFPGASIYIAQRFEWGQERARAPLTAPDVSLIEQTGQDDDYYELWLGAADTANKAIRERIDEIWRNLNQGQ